MKRIFSLKSIREFFGKTIERFKTYIEISGLGEIARRYFVMNAFDGALTMLGVIMGALMMHEIITYDSLKVIIGAGVGGSFAMGVSGFFGAYMAESAERARELKQLEGAMLKSLEDSIYGKAYRFAIIMAALIDSLAPMLSAFISLIPLILAYIGIIPVASAAFISIALIFIMLFLLGVFLGAVSKENIMVSGIKMLFAGFITAIISFILHFL
jgi:predicted membrane protein (TIGR00267 family)